MEQEYLRLVTENDCEQLFAWANDPECRQNSLNSNQIEYKEHCNWFKKRLHSAECEMSIFMSGQNPVGQIRIEKQDGDAVISYSVAKAYRHKGFGERMVQALLDLETASFPFQQYRAIVKKENIGSQRIFEKYLFIKTEKDDCFIYYRPYKEKIAIRCDGNSKIGLGHVMRCLCIAFELQKQDVEVLFLLAQEDCEELIHNHGFQAEVLSTNYKCMEEELIKVPYILKERKIGKILIDSYQVTTHYLSELSARFTVSYIDDLNEKIYPVQQLINYNIYAENLEYPQTYQNSKICPEFVLGCSYAPIREEFLHVDYEVRQEVKHILITTGGSDSYGIAGQILKHVMSQKELCKCVYHVISGAFNVHYEELKQMEKENDHIIIHQNVTDMAELMEQMDLAVSAGGSTMYELCAVGVPTVVYYFADNQKLIAKAFDQKGLAKNAGCFQEIKDAMFDQITEHLCAYQSSFRLRSETSKYMRAVIDGRGAKQLAKKVIMIRRDCCK